MEDAIFISYRQTDAGPWAARLRDFLVPHFGAERVYRDIDSNIPGHNWEERITAAMTASRAVLVLIGPTWATTTDALGHRRLDSPEDHVRQEVMLALRDKLVYPILINGASMPRPADLPEPLRPLTQLQAWQLPDYDWSNRVFRLVEELQGLGIQSAVPGTSTPETRLILTTKKHVRTLPTSPERAYEVVLRTLSLMHYRLLAADRETRTLNFTWGNQSGPLGKLLGRSTKSLGRGKGVVATLRSGDLPGTTELTLLVPTANWIAKTLAVIPTYGATIAWPVLEWALVRMLYENIDSVMRGQALRHQSVTDFLKNRTRTGLQKA